MHERGVLHEFLRAFYAHPDRREWLLYAGRAHSARRPNRSFHMDDVLFLGLGVGSLLLALAYARACNRLLPSPRGGTPHAPGQS
jgi:hypothetical protein